mgnify:CR=1 FL=1
MEKALALARAAGHYPVEIHVLADRLEDILLELCGTPRRVAPRDEAPAAGLSFPGATVELIAGV